MNERKPTIHELGQRVIATLDALNQRHVELEAAREEERASRQRETTALNAFNEASRAVHAAREAYDKAVGIEADNPALRRRA